jgi:hypothetical protein
MIFGAALVAIAGSATSSQNQTMGGQPAVAGVSNPPPPVAMESTRSLGLWKSSFGAVKIEDAGQGAVQGVWMYPKNGQDVIGSFFGTLRGNVLEFQWQEPGQPMLTGNGYIAFNPSGQSFSGRWWTTKRDRVGDWSGWRAPPAQPAVQPSNYGAAPYGGAGYGGAAPYYPQQPTQPQPYYPQQPAQPYYPQSGQPQPYYPQQPAPQPYYPQQPAQPQPYPPR